MAKRTDIDCRLSVGFSDQTLARINRLTWRCDPTFSDANDIGAKIGGSACDLRQLLIRRIIEEGSLALEDSINELLAEDDRKSPLWFRFDVPPKGTPRAYERRQADEDAVRQLLNDVAL